MKNRKVSTEAKDSELAQMLTAARQSTRLQLLEVLEAKLDRLSATNANAEEILSTLKAWAKPTIIKEQLL